MSESLIQQYHVGEEGNFIVKPFVKKIMTLFTEEVLGQFCAAAAVRQKELVLFLVIRCKVLVDALNS